MQLHKDRNYFEPVKFIFALHQCSLFMIVLLSIGFLLTLAYIILLLMYRAAWQDAPEYRRQSSTAAGTFISVLVPARNEEQHLPALLRSLQVQTYPSQNFEVIVVDDFSTDNTAELCRQYPFVKLVSLADFVERGSINAYKKKALEMAILQSSGELVITTDADCEVPALWLETIADCYAATCAPFIVMPVMMTHNRRSLEIFQVLDFMTLQGITGAAVHRQMHSMCNGANLAYARSAFEAVNGFAGIDHIASGDDMLLMHKIAARYPGKIQYLKSRDVIVRTAPMPSVAAFFNQRIRWASKADQYDDKRIVVVLLAVYLLNVLMAVLPVSAIFYIVFGAYTSGYTLLAGWLILLTAKTVVEMIYLYPVARFFGSTALLKYFPLAEPFHIVYTLIAGWLGRFGTYKWKGRRVK